ncbi:MAG: pirin family protein [Deltaproteobacteria bacterium]|nr:pirin family protein [Kofleriaceae bacterium]
MTSPANTSFTIRRARERGHADHGWLDSFHTFSFADYHDPQHMGFRALRVINDDTVAPGMGFGAHGHQDMEILSYVLDGELAHKDSMGNGSVIRPGEVQRMSAGTGVRHSEMNPSRTEPVHFLQIWIIPDRRGHAPGYEQIAFPEGERRGVLRLVASPDGANGSVSIHQDVRVYAGLFDRGESATHVVPPGRHAWIHVARGKAQVAGTELGAGDAVSTSAPGELGITGDGAEVLVFDLS